jgi:hypothetical protein
VSSPPPDGTRGTTRGEPRHTSHGLRAIRPLGETPGECVEPRGERVEPPRERGAPPGNRIDGPSDAPSRSSRSSGGARFVRRPVRRFRGTPRAFVERLSLRILTRRFHGGRTSEWTRRAATRGATLSSFTGRRCAFAATRTALSALPAWHGPTLSDSQVSLETLRGVPRVCPERDRPFAGRPRPFLARRSSFLEPPSPFPEPLCEVSARLSSRRARLGDLPARLSSLSARPSPFVATRSALAARRGASPAESGQRQGRRCECGGQRSLTVRRPRRALRLPESTPASPARDARGRRESSSVDPRCPGGSRRGSGVSRDASRVGRLRGHGASR